MKGKLMARDESMGWPLVARMVNFDGMKCEEASILSKTDYIPCGHQAVALVWHSRDRRVYLMCLGCASHNIQNRGGRLIVDATHQSDLLREVARTAKHKMWLT